LVDLVVLQTLSYTAGALSVVLGVIYYAINLRESRRTMHITLTNNLIQRLLTDEFTAKITELMYMEWKDYDDFERNYGSDDNPENFNKRSIVWNTYDSLGILLLKGLADRDVLYNCQEVFTSLTCGPSIGLSWRRTGGGTLERMGLLGLSIWRRSCSRPSKLEIPLTRSPRVIGDMFRRTRPLNSLILSSIGYSKNLTIKLLWHKPHLTYNRARGKSINAKS
jgi:hypothetical protein